MKFKQQEEYCPDGKYKAFLRLVYMKKIGVKKVSEIKTLSRCPLHITIEKIGRRHNNKHSNSLKSVKAYFERKGYICYEETKVSDDTFIGSIDILCENDNKIILIVEVKSYPIHRASLSDYYQILQYLKIYRENYFNQKDINKKIEALLVYFDKRHREYYYLKIIYNEDEIKKIDPNNVELSYILLLSKSDYKLPGKWCRWCGRIKCEYKIE